ncbi:MAG: AbrB/MazE/SpoVT family DNA-binding domain-containing protein [Vulcanimicrobiaceae bacterium]
MKSIVSKKGQVTIPKFLRDGLGIDPGTELEFEEEHGKLVARRVPKRDPLGTLVGLLPRMNVDEALEGLRGTAWSRELDDNRSHRRDRRQHEEKS